MGVNRSPANTPGNCSTHAQGFGHLALVEPPDTTGCEFNGFDQFGIQRGEGAVEIRFRHFDALAGDIGFIQRLGIVYQRLIAFGFHLFDDGFDAFDIPRQVRFGARQQAVIFIVGQRL